MSRLSIALPDETRGWNLWSGGDVVSSEREIATLAEKHETIAIGAPATLCSTFAVTVPTIDASLFENMVLAQIEKRGLGSGSPEDTVFQHEVIQQEGNDTLLSVDVLSHDFPETLCFPRAAGYAPAARLLKLPPDRLLLWREHKRLILAANRNGRLTYVQTLSTAPILDVAAAQEVNLTCLSLQAEKLVPENPDILVAGNLAGDKDRDAFEKSLILTAEFTTESPAPEARPDLNPAFLPVSVRQARARRSSTRKRNAIVLLTVAVYAVAGALIWLHAQSTRTQIENLEALVEETRPEVKEIQETEQRWRELEPAIDLRYFPLVQLNEITKAMPGSGVLIREYETRGKTIFVRGQARDVQMAFRLVEDLKSTEFFTTYDWNMPQPKVEQNNAATFSIQGEPKHAGTE